MSLFLKPKKYWSFVLFVDDNPIMYYPYKFVTKGRCKITAQLLADIMHANRICIYDSRHYPGITWHDLPLAPTPNNVSSFESK